ncbi:hypothetical protein [Chelativorans sp.]|uniref:hypothetical protein n=1 Tax=Chelativorans sp. TaxID=2203393 RepID=UPI002811F6E7|nr:hypothetical protein [Chelativorans sp.]
MTTYFIIYDLNKEAENYAKKNKAVRDRIKELFSTYWSHLDSTWIVVTDMKAKAIRDDLKTLLDNNDELLVASAGGEGAWHGFNDKGSKWLKDNL